MAFQTKRPPIQMELSKNTFNKLVELLNYNALNNSQIGAEANTLKEKLLKYSIPKEEENRKECVKFGFFQKKHAYNEEAKQFYSVTITPLPEKMLG